jgi:hypothetical protein
VFSLAENKQEIEIKTLKYSDLDAILEDISEMPEVSREQKEVKRKDEIIKALEKGILSMLRKGYSIRATTDFLNERLSPYSVSEAEVKKLLRKVTEKKKTSSAKSASKGKKKEPAISEQNSVTFDDPSTPKAEIENGTQQGTKVKMPNAVSDEERIYLVSKIAEKDEIKALGARYEPSKQKWYIWQSMPQGEKEKFKKWLPKM